MKARSQEQVTDPADPLVDELVERQFRWLVRHRYADEAAGRVAAREMVLDRLPRSRLIRTPVGFVWLGPEGEQTPVYDVRADHVADVPSLRALAIALSAAPLLSSVVPGEPSQEAFVAGEPFRLMATNMRLDVTAPLLGEGLAARVAVVAMTEDELAAFHSGAVESYARSREEAGESAALARARSEESLAEMFPDGRPAPGHHLFSVREDGEPAGVLWVCERWPAQAFVYDVEVDEAFRGRGLGAAAMVHAALWTRERGLAWLGLNVFGPNTHARALYERLGYLVEEEHFVHSVP